MLISVVNHTNGKLTDKAVQDGIRAVNRQIAHDFSPHWHLDAELRLEGAIGDDPDAQHSAELRGDAIIYLWDDVDVDDALGYHDATARGVPFGFVFTELVQEIGEPWTVTLSHEALELLADPEVNLLVAGPHPADPDAEVFHWYEMCDAVQDERYEVDGIEVSNFVLPLYFTADRELGGRNDFLGTVDPKTKTTLTSFGINPGGYVGFYNPATGNHETFALQDDARAKKRLAVKAKAQIARRSARHQLGMTYRERMRNPEGGDRRRGMRGPESPARAPRRGRAVECIHRSKDRPGPGMN